MADEQSSPSGAAATTLVRPQIVPDPGGAPLRIILEQPGSRFGRFGRRLLWVLLGLSLLFNLRFLADQAVDNPLPEKFHSLNRHARDKVAILAVKGTIAGEERYFQRQIEQIRHDDRVKAIVLRVESPGGTITGSDFIYHHIQKLIQEKDIPMVVSMGSIAASGGYYVSMSVGDKKKVLYA